MMAEPIKTAEMKTNEFGIVYSANFYVCSNCGAFIKHDEINNGEPLKQCGECNAEIKW